MVSALVACRVAQAGQEGEDDDDDEVLDEEDTDGDPAVEQIEVLFLVEQFDNDDGAAEGERGGQEDGLYVLKPVRARRQSR
jgi:hypothetical protein